MNYRKLIIISIDLLIVLVAFLIAAWLKPATVRIVIPVYMQAFSVFCLIWLALSFIGNKYNQIENKHQLNQLLIPTFVSNFVILGFTLTLLFGLKIEIYSRLLVFGTIGFATLAETVCAISIYSVYRFRKKPFKPYLPKKKQNAERVNLNNPVEMQAEETLEINFPKIDSYQDSIHQALKSKYLFKHEQIFAFCNEHIDLKAIPKSESLVLNTKTLYNIENIEENSQSLFLNLHRINDIIRINRYFILVNQNLVNGGYLLGNVETLELRKRRFFSKFPVFLNTFLYLFDYLFRRVLPKLPFTKQIYFFVTNGQNRIISKAEILGRLYSCGFEIVAEQIIANKYYFIAQKFSEPIRNIKPTYGVISTLKRVGQGGRMISVYKMRTMYPYSEYVQDYIYKLNKLKSGGKFKDDFRITVEGRFMRKFWIDELPMLWNLMKGDMKLVGVRPLSLQYFSLYPKDFRTRRIKYKPGLLPPFYADMPKTLEDIIKSEERYFDEYDRKPYVTDIKYLLRAAKNIIIKKERSN